MKKVVVFLLAMILISLSGCQNTPNILTEAQIKSDEEQLSQIDEEFSKAVVEGDLERVKTAVQRGVNVDKIAFDSVGRLDGNFIDGKSICDSLVYSVEYWLL